MNRDSWSYCKAALLRHSRTFAVPISFLPPSLERSITCSYLVCRIADTVEDAPHAPALLKEELYRLLLDVLAGTKPASAFVSVATKLERVDPAEAELLGRLETVLECLDDGPPSLRQSCRNWMGELVRGMAIYTWRQPGRDGVVCLESEPDLERYCYFVAGTIGRLLTDAFIEETRLTDPKAIAVLHSNAERFGAGLQLVNILRDITADLQRDTCFIPRTLLAQAGLEPRDLTAAQHRDRALRALASLFQLAETHLKASFEYVLHLPAEATGIRCFCLIPLWLAVRTLNLCCGNPQILIPENRVKLEKSQVLKLIAQCTAQAGNDAALSSHFSALWLAEPDLPSVDTNSAVP